MAKILLHKSEMCEIQVIFYFDRQVVSRFVEASQNCVYNSTKGHLHRPQAGFIGDFCVSAGSVGFQQCIEHNESY